MDEMLVIVVDGSINLSSHWDNIKIILESIVRRFCADEASSSDPSVKKYNLSLIINDILYDSAAQSDGTIRLGSLLHSLSNLTFDEDGPLGDSGVSKGLSTALMLFQYTKKQQTQLSWKQHCVLVTASHPGPDAEKIASSFIESFVSFSVICPRDDDNIVQYPSTIALNQYPQLLLSISDNFPEAREALANFAADDSTNTYLDQDPLVSSANFSNEEYKFLENILSQPQMEQEIEDENIPIIAEDEISGDLLYDSTLNANIIGETSAPEPISHVHDEDEISDALQYDSMLNANIIGETSALEPISHVHDGNNSIIQQVMQTEYLQDELNVAGGAIENNPEEMEGFNISTSRDICNFQASYSNLVARSNHFNMNDQIIMANLLSSDVHILEGTAESSAANHPSQSNIPMPNNTFHLSISWLLNNNPEKILKSSDSKILTPRTNALIPDNVPSSSRLTTSNGVNSSCGKMLVLGEKNRTPSMSYPTTKHVRSSMNTHRASINKNGKKKLLSTKSPSSRVTNSSDCILARNVSSGGIYGHIKAWEGSIASRGSGVEIFVSKLVAYRNTTVPEKTFKNWPKMMQLYHLVPCTQPQSSLIQVNKIPLVFSILDSCPILDHMKEKNLCGYVSLPGQMLKVWISEDKSILMGTLFEACV